MSEIDFGYWRAPDGETVRLTWNRESGLVYARYLWQRKSVPLGLARDKKAVRRLLSAYVRNARLKGRFPL